MTWQRAPGDPELAKDEVQVWRASLLAEGESLARLLETLTGEERARGERFSSVAHRRRFVVARAALRGVLSRVLAVPPLSVRFRYESGGKPQLDVLHARSGIRFNLSHSGELALVAVARGRELGVDVEALRSLRHAEAVAARFFAPAEVARLRGSAAVDHDAAFLQTWTLKEAYVKAIGRGLAVPLNRFEVVPPILTGEARLRLLDAPGEARHWRLVTLDPGPGFVAALAGEGRGWEARCFEWCT